MSAHVWLQNSAVSEKLVLKVWGPYAKILEWKVSQRGSGADIRPCHVEGTEAQPRPVIQQKKFLRTSSRRLAHSSTAR